MAYGNYGYSPYGHGALPVAGAQPQASAQTAAHARLLRDAIDRFVRGSTKDDPDQRAIEDGVVPGSATAQD